jgi:hypothetical protein
VLLVRHRSKRYKKWAMQWNRGYKPAYLWEGPGLTPWRNHRKQLRAKFRQGNDDNYLRHARFCKRRKEAGFTERQAEAPGRQRPLKRRRQG